MDESTYQHRKQLALESKQRSIEKRMNRELSNRTGYNLIDKKYNVKEGHCKLSRQRTLQHELAKAKVMHLCMSIGQNVYSEVIFTNHSGIADIYLPDGLRVYEILESETANKFNEKVKTYPAILEIIPLRAEDVLKDGFKL